MTLRGKNSRAYARKQKKVRQEDQGISEEISDMPFFACLIKFQKGRDSNVGHVAPYGLLRQYAAPVRQERDIFEYKPHPTGNRGPQSQAPVALVS